MSFVARTKRFVDVLKRAGYRSGSGKLILLYHRVAELRSDPWQLCVAPRHFRQHMQWLSENACVVPLDEMSGVLRQRRSRLPVVAVTFDDGYADNLHEVLPVLEEYGIPATFFFTVPWLAEGHEFWWDELERIFLQPSVLPSVLRLSSDPEAPVWHLEDTTRYTAEAAAVHRQWRAWEPPPTARHAIYAALRERLYGMLPDRRRRILDEILDWADVEPLERPTHRRMTRDEVVALSRSPLVEVGAHSVSHTALPTLSPARRAQEITLSRHALTQLVDRPVTSFAYPHGDYCPATAEVVRTAGFLRACTTRSGNVQRQQDPFALPRICVGDWDGEEFGRQIATWHALASQ
jgi:peptidoglycan/xylan/chitin deacetylase (PgdA/CDA1 family)